MTIDKALLNLCFGKKYVKREGWSDAFISVSYNSLTFHCHRNDLIGREWQPTFYDLTQKDWIAF